MTWMSYKKSLLFLMEVSLPETVHISFLSPSDGTTERDVDGRFGAESVVTQVPTGLSW